MPCIEDTLYGISTEGCHTPGLENLHSADARRNRGHFTPWLSGGEATPNRRDFASGCASPPGIRILGGGGVEHRSDEYATNTLNTPRRAVGLSPGAASTSAAAMRSSLAVNTSAVFWSSGAANTSAGAFFLKRRGGKHPGGGGAFGPRDV